MKHQLMLSKLNFSMSIKTWYFVLFIQQHEKPIYLLIIRFIFKGKKFLYIKTARKTAFIKKTQEFHILFDIWNNSENKKKILQTISGRISSSYSSHIDRHLNEWINFQFENSWNLFIFFIIILRWDRTS